MIVRSETKARSQVRKQRRKFVFVVLILGIISAACFLLSISYGRAGFTDPYQVLQSLMGNEKYAQMMRILQNIRIPRACASFLVGACLSVSGLAYQTTFNNKLVSPDILGVGSGCCVGAGIAILFGFSSGTIRLLAFVVGFITVLITVLLPKLFRNHSALMLVLSGIIVGSFMDSILALIKYAADKNDKLADIIFWIMGSLVGIQNDEVMNSLWISIIPFIFLLIMGWRINVISLGPEEAQALGINYNRNRLIIIACATLLTANCVSISGNVGWVGLVIPHIARTLVGDNVRRSMPVSALCGGIFLMVVDTLSRIVSVNEVPLSIITGFVGGIIYTIVLIRRGRYINE